MGKKTIAENIFDVVGDTPIIRININDIGCKVFGKAEFMNPTGSIKDRFVKHVLTKAMNDGLIRKGSTIIEATSGNTGISIAAFGAIYGMKVKLVMSDKMSLDKVNIARSLGAEVVITKASVDAEDPLSYQSVAKRMHEEMPNSFFVNQYDNHENANAHYYSTGKEICEQIEGSEIGAVFMGIGTGGTMSGVGRYIKEHRPDVKIICVDPIGSGVTSYLKHGKLDQDEVKMFQIEGIGHHEVTKNFDASVVDDIVRIDDVEAFEAARLMARESAIFAGGSSGGIVAGAVKYVKDKSFTKDALCVLPDSGDRYVSKFYEDGWFNSFKANFKKEQR